MDSISFLASISPVTTAIKVDGSGGGARIQLDIPESDMNNVVALTALRECTLRVTVQVEQEERPSRVRIDAGDTEA